MNISIRYRIVNKNNIINSGIAKMLYFSDEIKFNFNISLKALVSPQAGQDILKIFLNKHGQLINWVKRKRSIIIPITIGIKYFLNLLVLIFEWDVVSINVNIAR